MTNIESERVLARVREPIWPLFREVEEVAGAHSVTQTDLMRCLSAGWLSHSDLAFVLPVIVAAEAARRGAFELLVARMGETADAMDVTGAFADSMMVRWAEAQDLPPQQPGNLPSFAKYFVLRYETLCQASTPVEAVAFLLAGQTVSDRLLTALAKGGADGAGKRPDWAAEIGAGPGRCSKQAGRRPDVTDSTAGRDRTSAVSLSTTS